MQMLRLYVIWLQLKRFPDADSRFFDLALFAQDESAVIESAEGILQAC